MVYAGHRSHKEYLGVSKFNFVIMQYAEYTGLYSYVYLIYIFNFIFYFVIFYIYFYVVFVFDKYIKSIYN